MHIGLIVGIGPAATDFYYRRLIAALAAAGTPLELTMAHADMPTLLRNQAAGDAGAQVAIYLRLAGRPRPRDHVRRRALLHRRLRAGVAPANSRPPV